VQAIQKRLQGLQKGSKHKAPSKEDNELGFDGNQKGLLERQKGPKHEAPSKKDSWFKLSAAEDKLLPNEAPSKEDNEFKLSAAEDKLLPRSDNSKGQKRPIMKSSAGRKPAMKSSFKANGLEAIGNTQV
jgi:hypothetical protein